MNAAVRRSAPTVAGAAVLAAVLWRTGTGPVLAALRGLDAGTLVLGGLLSLLTTTAGAYRWRLVARGLGTTLDLRTAVASCYASQLLNATLPGGVVGDVHRGVRHGHAVGATGLGVRAVVWERVAGQVVQAALAVVVLCLLPSPVRGVVRWALPALAVVLVGVVVGAVGGTGVVPGVLRRVGTPAQPASRLLRAAAGDVRRGLLARDTWPGVVAASTVAVTGYLATYLLAAHAVGVPAPPGRLVPLALLVLLAAGLPLNVAGWGPREGVAAWTFGAAGLGAAQGVATSVAYGALVLVGTLPGVVVLVARGRARGVARAAEPASRPQVLTAGAHRG